MYSLLFSKIRLFRNTPTLTAQLIRKFPCLWSRIDNEIHSDLIESWKRMTIVHRTKIQTYTRTKALISARQRGHVRREWPHGTQLMKCPQGMQATCFSSVKQRTQGFEGDDVCISSRRSCLTELSDSLVPSAFVLVIDDSRLILSASVSNDLAVVVGWMSVVTEAADEGEAISRNSSTSLVKYFQSISFTYLFLASP